MNTHNTGNPSPNRDPPPPLFLNNPISTQPSTNHSPHQYNTPSNSPPPLNPIITQPFNSQILQTLPPIPLFLPFVTTTQPQSHSS